jgi:hypothetical protein
MEKETDCCVFCEICGGCHAVTPFGEQIIEFKVYFACLNCGELNFLTNDFKYYVKATREEF